MRLYRTFDFAVLKKLLYGEILHEKSLLSISEKRGENFFKQYFFCAHLRAAFAKIIIQENIMTLIHFIEIIITFHPLTIFVIDLSIKGAGSDIKIKNFTK